MSGSPTAALPSPPSHLGSVQESSPAVDDTHVGVSVVNYRSREATVALVQDLATHRGSGPVSVLCIDNSDDDEEFTRLERSLEGLTRDSFTVTVWKAPGNLGYGRAHNVAVPALMEAGAGVVLIANPDVNIVKGSLDDVRQATAHDPQRIYGCTTVEDGRCYSGLARVNAWTSGTTRTRRGRTTLGRIRRTRGHVHYPSGHFISMTATAWQEVGGFCQEYFLYYEEPDFMIRAQRRGYLAASIAGLVVEHDRGLSTRIGNATGARHSDTTLFHATRSSIIFTRRHFPGRMACVLACRGLYALRAAASDRQALRLVLRAMRAGLRDLADQKQRGL